MDYNHCSHFKKNSTIQVTEQTEVQSPNVHLELFFKKGTTLSLSPECYKLCSFKPDEMENVLLCNAPWIIELHL